MKNLRLIDFFFNSPSEEKEITYHLLFINNDIPIKNQLLIIKG